jgi:transposase InsO family protein
MSTNAGTRSLKVKYKNSDRREYIQAKHMRVRSWTNIKVWAAKQLEKTKPRKERGKEVRRLMDFLGVSKQSLYSWLSTYQKFGKKGLKPQSRRPKTIQRISPELEQEILEVKENTDYGCEKIAFDVLASTMTIWRYLTKNKQLNKRKFRRRKWKYFQRKHSNSLWQIDLSQLTEEVWSISIIDDHSRFITGFKVCQGVPTVDEIVSELEHAFSVHGMPRQILTDRGSQFVANRPGAVSTFDLWCHAVGILHIKAGRKKPTTTGKVEKWHDVLKKECIQKASPEILLDFNLLQNCCREFINYYNYSRPHFIFEIDNFYGMTKRRRRLIIPFLHYATHRRTDADEKKNINEFDGASNCSVNHVVV